MSGQAMAIKFVDIEPENKKPEQGATPPPRPVEPVPAENRDLLGPVGPKPEPKKKARKAPPRSPA